MLAGELAGLSDRQLVARAKQIAYELDPHSVAERIARAEADRRVTIRPAPDAMTLVSALLPVAQGVALYAALRQEAGRARAAGDPRGRGQVMADTLVCRTTGQQAAGDVAVEVQLVISDETLLGGGDAPARVVGHGPIPAGIARRLTHHASEIGRASLRRLYARPADGRLVAMESRQRIFPEGLREFLAIRDQLCRTPWCGAPIRHADHAIPARAGGETSASNGQGLCEQCNQAKEHPGWQARPDPDGRVVLTTPSKGEYTSLPPPIVLPKLEHWPVVGWVYPRLGMARAA